MARLPDEPPELAYSLLVGSSDITVRLSWEVPFVPVADPPITGYKVVWGPVLPPVNHLLMDQSLAESRELRKVHFELIFVFLVFSVDCGEQFTKNFINWCVISPNITEFSICRH